jgi:arginase family enzyme
MPYAVTLGWDLDDWREAAGLKEPVRAEAATLIGASDLDGEESAALDTHPIARLDAEEMDTDGAATQALLAPRAPQADAWYLHLDVDVAGPNEVPGAMTPAPHWPQRAPLIDSIRTAAHTVPLRAMSLAAYNPQGDPERRGARFGLDALDGVLDGIAQATLR